MFAPLCDCCVTMFVLSPVTRFPALSDSCVTIFVRSPVTRFPTLNDSCVFYRRSHLQHTRAAVAFLRWSLHPLKLKNSEKVHRTPGKGDSDCVFVCSRVC